MSRETEENSRSRTNASCDHGLEKRQFLQNFPFIMNSQAHNTLCWHTQPGCFRVLVKQTGPTGCMCTVTVTGCGSLAEMLVISPATGHDAVTMPTVVKGAGLWHFKKMQKSDIRYRTRIKKWQNAKREISKPSMMVGKKQPEGSPATSKLAQERRNLSLKREQP